MGNYPSLSNQIHHNFFAVVSVHSPRLSLSVNEEVCRLVVVVKVIYPNATRPTIEYYDSIVRNATDCKIITLSIFAFFRKERIRKLIMDSQIRLDLLYSMMHIHKQSIVLTTMMIQIIEMRIYYYFTQ